MESFLKKESFSKQKIKGINKQLIALEKSFISEKGMYFGSWYRSLYAASDPYSGYGAWILPGVEYEIANQETKRLTEWDNRYAEAILDLKLKMEALLMELK
jgi:N-acetylated-alpha-linked acidic dipeptidase